MRTFDFYTNGTLIGSFTLDELSETKVTEALTLACRLLHEHETIRVVVDTDTFSRLCYKRLVHVVNLIDHWAFPHHPATDYQREQARIGGYLLEQLRDNLEGRALLKELFNKAEESHTLQHALLGLYERYKEESISAFLSLCGNHTAQAENAVKAAFGAKEANLPMHELKIDEIYLWNAAGDKEYHVTHRATGEALHEAGTQEEALHVMQKMIKAQPNKYFTV